LKPLANQTASRREIISWAMYDFANSGYTTVVLTALFNAYYVGVIAAGEAGYDSSQATFLWTATIACANALVLVTAPIVGAMADLRARKKRYLLITTMGCVAATACLSLAGPGDVLFASILVMLGTVMFASGENLIAAFLPEIAPPHRMGRISGYGWSLGYIGGVLTLLLCLGWVQWSTSGGASEAESVPATMLITATVFALAAVPTFLWLRERATPAAPVHGMDVARNALGRLLQTVREVRRFRDLFLLLITIAVYQSGVITVVVLAAVYAQEVMNFGTRQLLLLILVVNITSAIGAFLFGFFQDRIGSVSALMTSLAIWVLAVSLAVFATEPRDLWIVGNLVGLAMGASQSINPGLSGGGNDTATGCQHRSGAPGCKRGGCCRRLIRSKRFFMNHPSFYEPSFWASQPQPQPLRGSSQGG
jgi:UMF1 family MFS transporter